MNAKLASCLIVLAAASASPSARSAEAYDNCTRYVDAVPAVIGRQGTWCLRADLHSGLASGDVVTIAAHNVTLDCNDFKISGVTVGKGTRAIGIRSNGALNTTVRNCNVRGFHYGIALAGDGHVVEDNLLLNNTYAGISVDGDGAMVRRNRVLDTGGATGLVSYLQAVGIVTGGKADVEDNVVDGVVATAGSDGYAIGIHPLDAAAGSVAGHRVRDIVADGAGVAIGISVRGPATGRVVVTGNHVLGNAIGSSYGILCPDAENNRVLVAGNSIVDWGTPVAECRFDRTNEIVTISPM